MKMEINEIEARLHETIGPALSVNFNYLELPIEEVQSDLINKIQAIIDEDDNLFIKIGKSSDPIDRFIKEYEPKGFNSMEVIYRSRNYVDIEGEKGEEEPSKRGAEGRMLAHFGDEMEVLNIRKGSAGELVYEKPFHYLYVAIAKSPLKRGAFEEFKKKVDSLIEDYKKHVSDLVKAKATISA